MTDTCTTPDELYDPGVGILNIDRFKPVSTGVPGVLKPWYFCTPGGDAWGDYASAAPEPSAGEAANDWQAYPFEPPVA